MCCWASIRNEPACCKCPCSALTLPFSLCCGFSWKTVQAGAGGAAGRSQNGLEPLCCCQFLATFGHREFWPEQLKHNALSFLVHQSEDMGAPLA